VAARAACLIKKAKHFAQRIGIRGVPQKCSDAPYIDQADLFQFFQVMRKRGRWNLQLFLHFSRDHSGWVSGKQQPQNGQPRFGAERGKAVRRAGDQEWIGLLHISIIAEIQKKCQLFFLPTLLPLPASNPA